MARKPRIEFGPGGDHRLTIGAIPSIKRIAIASYYSGFNAILRYPMLKLCVGLAITGGIPAHFEFMA